MLLRVRRIAIKLLAGTLTLALLALLTLIALATQAAWPPDFAAWDADDWAAFGGIGTLLVALVTGPLILRQVIHAQEAVQEARKSREQQAKQAREQSQEQAEREQRLRQEQADQTLLVMRNQADTELRLRQEQDRATLDLSREQAEREQRLREDQARPFVVVDFEPSPVWGNIINLVVQNVGKTLAKNVRLTFDPPLVSSMAGNDGYNFQESNLLKHGIPGSARCGAG